MTFGRCYFSAKIYNSSTKSAILTKVTLKYMIEIEHDVFGQKGEIPVCLLPISIAANHCVMLLCNVVK